jgi:heme oxygenase
MDVNKLYKALDDESNESLMNFTSKKILEMNLKIINELELQRKHALEIMKKLKGYKYVDELSDLKYGAYIRWIPITDPNPNNIKITKGALFCDTKIKEDGVYLICKNYGYINKHFQIKLDENLVFQKLTDQEQVLLSALDHLSK